MTFSSFSEDSFLIPFTPSIGVSVGHLLVRSRVPHCRTTQIPCSRSGLTDLLSFIFPLIVVYFTVSITTRRSVSTRPVSSSIGNEIHSSLWSPIKIRVLPYHLPSDRRHNSLLTSINPVLLPPINLQISY